MKIPKCDCCGQPIWNPEWWDSDTGMCGVCTMGESKELYHSSWIAPDYKNIKTDKKFREYWENWYKNIYLKIKKSNNKKL
jgi:hypothetical protein